MTEIDEAIAGLIGVTAACIAGASTDADVMQSSRALSALITQAIAEARADGAREMRELCATVCDTTPPHPFRPSIEAAHAVRALPLPAKREPVLLTDGEIVAPVVDGFGATTNDWASHIEFARTIETAVLAANGLEVAR